MRQSILSCAALFLLVFRAMAPLCADELLPPDRPIQEVIDHYVDARLKAENVAPAPQADEATLVRRSMLDLAGRIPTAAEAKAYVESEDIVKREKLVDRLLNSPDFVRHQRNELDRLLAYDEKEDGGFREFLLDAVEENRPWDKLFREMLLSEDKGEEGNPALTFVKQRAKDTDRLANDVSVLFFGVNVSCAKCHNHPLVDDWKQDHFFGMKSFFNRTFVTKSNHLGEAAEGIVEFQTVEGEKKTAKLMFLTGAVIEEPPAKNFSDKEKNKQKKRLEELAKKKQPPPPPEFSRREKLVDTALEDGEFFSRNIVNRVWHRLIGHGFVNPVDQMHSANPPTHPDLLAWLARDLREHNYDLKRLIRGIVLSRAYSRGSRWEQGEPPPKDLFAVGQLRPLTPRQLAASMIVAAAAPGTIQPGDMDTEDWSKRVAELENQARGIAGRFEMPDENFQVSVDEALLFSNEQGMQDLLLSDSSGKLIGHLKTIEGPQERISAAFWNIFTRPPAADELQAISAYIEKRKDRSDEALKHAVWALFTSSEMRFNY